MQASLNKRHKMSPHFLTSISLVMRNTDDKDHEAILLKSTKTAANPNLRNSPDTKANPDVTSRYSWLTGRPNRTLFREVYQNLACIKLLPERQLFERED